MKHETIINSLREKGFRITNARKAIIAFLSGSTKPVAALEIQTALGCMGITVNKTTIYREISFLLQQKLIAEIQFGEGKKRYESVDRKHHHHLVCLKCSDIRDVEMEADLENEEKRIERITGFQVQNHSLEFFGLCGNCR